MKVAEAGLVVATVANCLLGCAVAVTRVRYGVGHTPLSWMIVGALVAFLVTIVWHSLASSQLERVNRLADQARRRAVRAGLAGDRTAEQEAWRALHVLTGKNITP